MGKTTDVAGYYSGQAITPSDSADIPGGQIRGYTVAVTGDVKVTMASGDVVTWPARQAGFDYACQAIRIWATGTTATGIVAGR